MTLPDNYSRTQAHQAAEILQNEGEEAMLAFVRDKRRDPVRPPQDFHGYVVLQDGSTMTTYGQTYFVDGKPAGHGAPDGTGPRTTFEEYRSLFGKWPTVANLMHHLLKTLDDRPDGEHAIEIEDLFSRWPRVEREAMELADIWDVNDDTFLQVLEEEKAMAAHILKHLPLQERMEIEAALANGAATGE